MKKKTVAIAFISLLMCMCLFMTSCDLSFFEEVGEFAEDYLGFPKSDKEVIIDSIESIDLGAILEEAEGQSIESVLNVLKEAEAEVKINTTIDGTEHDIYLGIHNRIISAPNGEYGVITNNNDFIDFSQSSSGGLRISVSEYESSDTSLDIPEEVVEVIRSFEFPEMTEDDLIDRDGYYFVSDEYLREAVKYTFDLIIDVAQAAEDDEDLNIGDYTEEEYNEAVNTLYRLIRALGIGIGFSVDDQMISGMCLTLHTSTYDISEAVGETPDDERVTIDMELKMALDTEAGAVSDVDVDARITSNDVDVLVSAASETIFDSKNNPVGCDLTVDLDIAGCEISSDMIKIPEHYALYEDYMYVDIIGSIKINANVHADLSKIGKSTPSNVIDADVIVVLEPHEYSCYIYDNNYDEVYVEPWEYGVTIDLNEYGQDVNLNFSLDSLDGKNLEFRAGAEADDVTVGIKGDVYLSLDSCTMMEIPHSIIETASADPHFADKIRELEEIGEKIADKYCQDYWSSDLYVWHDNQTGLYVYVDRGGYVSIYTENPNSDAIYVNYDRNTGEIN